MSHKKECRIIGTVIYCNLMKYLHTFQCYLSGLVVACLPLDPKFAGSQDDGFLRVIKNSFGGEVKPSVPCRRFTAC
jgi:hypothetical protein